jgi:hypothetical protein
MHTHTCTYTAVVLMPLRHVGGGRSMSLLRYVMFEAIECIVAALSSVTGLMSEGGRSLEAVTGLMNEGVERLCDTLARIAKEGRDVNIWRQFGALTCLAAWLLQA